jgi:hypothetical protein
MAICVTGKGAGSEGTPVVRPDFPLAAPPAPPTVGATMIAPETFSHLENIKKRAGYLWRFL